MKRQLGAVIAERVLEVAGTRRRLTVRLGPPRKDRGDWFCPYQLHGLGQRAVRRAYGADSFQALTLALKGIDADLTAIDEPLTWLGGRGGFTFFPLIIDTAFLGPSARRRVEKAGECETLAFFKREIAKRKRRRARRR